MLKHYNFGAIRTLRKKRRLTIAQLAELSHLTFPTLASIETNKTVPSLASLHQIAEALSISITSLLYLCRRTLVHHCAAEPVTSDEGPESARTFLAASHGDIQIYRIAGEEGTITNRQWPHEDVFEINYILSGQVEVTVEGRAVLAAANETFFFDGLSSHLYRFLSAGEIMIIHIPKNNLSLHTLLG